MAYVRQKVRWDDHNDMWVKIILNVACAHITGQQCSSEWLQSQWTHWSCSLCACHIGEQENHKKKCPCSWKPLRPSFGGLEGLELWKNLFWELTVLVLQLIQRWMMKNVEGYWVKLKLEVLQAETAVAGKNFPQFFSPHYFCHLFTEKWHPFLTSGG